MHRARVSAACVLAGLLAALPRGSAAAEAGPRKVPITVSRETTLLLGPLNADGTVNYVAAANELLGKGATPDNNAAIPLLRALGPSGQDDISARAPI